MNRRTWPLLAAVVIALVAAPAGWAHKGNPNYESKLRAVSPPIEGLEVQILNRDDRLELRNRTGETVLIEGYSEDPYVRISADGTVEVNQRSPARYLNEERDGNVDVPPEADKDAPPDWEEVSGTGTFEWHDHRIHWMGEGRPDQVTDEDKRTKVFDWRVPIRVANRPVELTGTLFWTPRDNGGPPLGAIVALAAFALASAVLVVVVRRRRRGARAQDQAEAW
jgi:hypothetical protein